MSNANTASSARSRATPDRVCNCRPSVAGGCARGGGGAGARTADLRIQLVMFGLRTVSKTFHAGLDTHVKEVSGPCVMWITAVVCSTRVMSILSRPFMTSLTTAWIPNDFVVRPFPLHTLLLLQPVVSIKHEIAFVTISDQKRLPPLLMSCKLFYHSAKHPRNLI